MESISRWLLGSLKKGIRSLFASFFLVLIKIYQRLISPLLGDCCRFYPSCSVYAAEILRESSIPIYRSLFFIIWRLLRCQPFSSGGIDFPLPVKQKRVTVLNQPVSHQQDLKNF